MRLECTVVAKAFAVPYPSFTAPIVRGDGQIGFSKPTKPKMGPNARLNATTPQGPLGWQDWSKIRALQKSQVRHGKVEDPHMIGKRRNVILGGQCRKRGSTSELSPGNRRFVKWAPLYPLCPRRLLQLDVKPFRGSVGGCGLEPVARFGRQ